MFFLKKKVLKKFNVCPYCKSEKIEKSVYYEPYEFSDYAKKAFFGAGKGATKFGLNGAGVIGVAVGSLVGAAAGVFKSVNGYNMKEVDGYICKKCSRQFEFPLEEDRYVRE